MQDWHNFLNERQGAIPGEELYNYRKQIYSDIERIRNRPLIVYASVLSAFDCRIKTV
jgi:hypothetical protein